MVYLTFELLQNIHFFIHKLSNAAKVINKGHSRGSQPTKCLLRFFTYNTSLNI
ncbi:hypothetical protein JCM6292_2771 [Bacteroides pyogenes JCM 6292]|uniref:Uncharacterized protein n=2 Tax=Bacteroides pyogenes TaxID=310300 RepID=W4PL15_9BACE|nr:hypothetical protein JCM6292_2771 [Bacteroides pyogenes JCM 6292]GAE19814.1 hypothetical protein JCM6294_2920 [Bacteroides pyogenes DSM 20611 = JCM 6294]